MMIGMQRWTCVFFMASAMVFGGEAAKKEEKVPEVPANFKIDTFATSPEIDSICGIAATPTGELFACEDPLNVRCNKSGTARILKLVDTKNVGKADKITVFADNVNAARGMIYFDNTLFAVQQPFLTAYRDEDGDGVAEKKVILVEGIGPAPEKVTPDHAVNGPRLAIDGWIYIAVGDQGVPNAVGKDGSKIQLLGGGVVRVRPDGSDLEIYCSGLRNCYDVNFDPFLNAFVRDNTNDGGGWNVRFAQVFQSAEYGYPSLFINYADEIVKPLADYGGGSGSGGMWIHEPSWPEGFNNHLYTADWGRSRIYRFNLEANGASFKPTQEEFYKGGRPLDVDMDGQGNFFVADWTLLRGPYGPNKERMGRIYRIQPKDLSRVKPYPNVDKATDAELIAWLGNENQCLRLHAQQIIIRRGNKPETFKALEEMAAGSAPLFARVAALFTLKQVAGAASHPALLRLAEKPELKEFALRALTDRKKELADVSPAPFLAALKDANPRVRQAAIVSLGRLGKTEVAGALLPLLADAEPILSHVAFKSLRALSASEVCLDALGKTPAEVTAGAFRALRGIHTTANVDGLIAKAKSENDPALKLELIRTIGRLYNREGDWDGSWFGIRPSTVGPYYKNQTWDGSERINAFLSERLSSGSDSEKEAVLESMGRFQILTEGLLAGLTKAAESGGKLQADAVKILVKMKSLNAESLPVLEKLALSETADVELRAQAVMAYERVNSPKRIAALIKLFPSLEKNQELYAAAHASLLKSKDKEAKEEIAGAWKEPRRVPALLEAIGKSQSQDMAAKVREHLSSADAAVRRAALSAAGSLQDSESVFPIIDLIEKNIDAPLAARALSRISPRKVAMLKLVETGDKLIEVCKKVPAGSDNAFVKDLWEFTKGVCNETRVPDADRKRLSAAIPKLPGSGVAGGAPRIADLTDVVDRVMKTSGNAEAGKPLFVKLTCVNCHALSTDEKPKGPYLGDIGVRYQKPQLVLSVYTPSAVITQGYETQLITLDDGVRIDGFVVSESGEQVELRNIQGESKIIQKSKIKKRVESKHSIMPEGLLDAMTIQDFADLLAYLESLKGAAIKK